MTASSLFFNGRLHYTPGSYSKVDASGLDTVGLSATGVVAVLGKAEGGVPISAITDVKDLQTFRTPEKMRETFRSGQLREVTGMLFEPSKDPDISGGAQKVVALKVNPATQSTAQLMASAVAQIDLESVDYGAFTEQINVELTTGTTQGKAITITFEGEVESGDDIGGDDMFTLQYSGGTNGYTTALASVNAAGDISVTATRTSLGKDSDVANPVTNAAIEIVSSNAADTTQSVILYGLVGGVVTKQTLALNGTSVVAGTGTTWDAGDLYGCRLSASCLGTVTVRIISGGATVFSLTTGQLSKGLAVGEYMFVDKTTVDLKLDAAGTPTVILVGKNAAGSELLEKIALTGATPVTSLTSTFAQIDYVALGDVAAARTFTLTARAGRTLAAVQSTLQKVKDYFDSKQFVIAGPTTRGFIFTFATGSTNFLAADLDIVTSVDINDPADGNFKADLYAIIKWINDNSQLITATESVGATTVPDNTATPLFLAGGVEGTALSSHYQTALNLLKQVRVNSVVDLSGDPAVAAMVDAHCAYMCGVGRSERDGFVGLLNGALDGLPDNDEITEQIVALNSRHMRACAQSIDRYNTDGERETFLPPYQAALAAGMQAGATVGTSLTHKYANVLSVQQDSTWNPTEDSEKMIAAGLLFMQNVDGVGRRWVRNVTTHLSTSNIAYTEGSVNQAVDYAVFNLRTRLEALVGKKGFAGTLSAARGIATGILSDLVAEGVITSFRALTVTLNVDVLEISVEIAPVIPINFVATTVHLTNAALVA